MRIKIRAILVCHILLFLINGCIKHSSENIGRHEDSSNSNNISPSSYSLVEAISPSVVKIIGQKQNTTNKYLGLGSGFIINKEGHLLTNFHIINGYNEIKIILHNGNELDAEVVIQNPLNNYAIIKIEPNPNLPVLQLGNSDDLSVGDCVIALGNPSGSGPIASAGIISAKEGAIKDKHLETYIQTDAQINPENSGGPLCNCEGKVIGLNTAMNKSDGTGFALPINRIKKMLWYFGIKND